MTPAPLVSVIIPAYNRSRFLKTCLKSLKRQTYKNFEVVFLDDGSRPPLLNIVRKMAFERLTYVYFKSNQGPAAMRNAGLRMARGELLALLDSDDVWFPQKLARQVDCFSDGRLMFVYSNVARIDGRGCFIRRRSIRMQKDRKHPVSLPYTSTVMFRRQLIDKIGFFGSCFRYLYDDSDFYTRVKKLGPRAVRYMPQVLAAYRRRKIFYRNSLKYHIGLPPRQINPTIRELLLDQAFFTLRRRRNGDSTVIGDYVHGYR